MDRDLTRREADVLDALQERLTNAEIAGRLFVSERTVESHVSSLLRKLGAANRRELANLAHDHSLRRPQRLPAPLELLVDAASFCGRRAELDTARALWHRASKGETLVCIVAGEAGIGKSRFVAELAAEVHRDAGQVRLGSCFEDARLEYEPFIEILRESGLPIQNESALARLAPAVTGAARDSVDDALVDVQMQRDIFVALHSYVSQAAELAPLLLVIEDVHWATSTTRGALRHLARVGGHVPLLTVITTRNTRPEFDDSLAVFLADLGRYPTVSGIQLAGLNEAEVDALLRHAGARTDAARVASETGGNPLFVRELAGVAPHSVGSSLPALLARRYGRLDDADLEVVDTAVVIGREFHVELVATASHTPVTDALDALERAEAAGLLLPDPNHPGRFAFTHELVRRARYDALSTSRRLSLHAEVARALAGRAEDGRVLGDLARHACIAAPLGGATAAAGYAVRAAEAAERALAFDEAAAFYRRALDVIDLFDPPDMPARLRLSIRLGENLQRAGRSGWLDLLLGATDIARSLCDPQALAEISLALARYTRGPRFAWWRGDPSRAGAADDEVEAIMREALDGLGPGPSAHRARLLAAWSENINFTDPAHAAEMAEEARSIASQLDDPLTLGHVLQSYWLVADTPENGEARHPTADELIGLGQQTGQSSLTILGLTHRARCFLRDGQLDAARRAIDAAEAVIGDRELPPWDVVEVLLHRSAAAFVGGDLAVAEQFADRVLSLATEDFDPTNSYGPAILAIRLAQDRVTELLPLIESATDQPGGIGSAYRPVLAVAYTHAQRLKDARAIIDELSEEGFAPVARNFPWLSNMAAIVSAIELTGHSASAGLIGDMLEPFSGQIAALPQAVAAPVDLVLAQAALAAGDLERANRFAAKASEASRERGTPIFLGRELIRLAAARRLLGGATSEVGPLMSEALSIADRTGAQLIRREAEHYHL